MWGKFIIGTKEAFCGFDITEEIGVCCESSEDFIKAIKEIEKHCSKFNIASVIFSWKNIQPRKSMEIVKYAIQTLH